MCRAAKSREAYESMIAATEQIEMEQTKWVPEHLKNIHFPVNPQKKLGTFLSAETSRFPPVAHS